MPSTRRQNVYISFRAAKVNSFGQLAKLFALFLSFVACFLQMVNTFQQQNMLEPTLMCVLPCSMAMG